MTRIRTSPGEMLSEEFMKPLGLNASTLAAAIDVPPNRITGILNKTRSITADTALRLGRYLNTSSELWLNLQQGYDLSKARALGRHRAIKPLARRRSST